MHQATDEPIKYLVARLRELLAQDPRTNVLDIDVKITPGQLFLIGQVESETRRAAIETVVRENAPADFAIVNELWIADYSHTTPAERLP